MDQELHIVNDAAGAIERVRDLVAQYRARRVLVDADERFHAQIMAAAPAGTNVTFAQDDTPGDQPHPVHLILRDDDDAVARALHARIPLTTGAVVTTRTRFFWRDNPLFFISIPKAGTHLSRKLLKVFGYQFGGVSDGLVQGGHFYYVYGHHAHSSAKAFFNHVLDFAAAAGIHHPFASSGAIFMYRDPRDIVVSLMHHITKMHYPGATYYHGLTDDEIILKVIDDKWLFDGLEHYITRYMAWFDFPNVIPVSFEELIGAKGGGNDAEQRATIWSLQLKLHIPGRPAAFAAHVFDPDSPTFHKGQIGAWREAFTPTAREHFAALPQDLMIRLGYSTDLADTSGLPAHRLAYRHRPLKMVMAPTDGIPLLMRQGVLGHNIVLFRRRLLAIPMDSGPLDLGTLSDTELARFLSADSLQDLEMALAIKVARAAIAGEHEPRIAALERQVAEFTRMLKTDMRGGAPSDHA